MVETQEPITDDALQQLRDGVQLHNEKDLTRPAIAERLGNYGLRLSISEGKYHQVKRMLEAVDNKVVELHREQIAGIKLGEDLAAGEYRPLTAAEPNLQAPSPMPCHQHRAEGTLPTREKPPHPY